MLTVEDFGLSKNSKKIFSNLGFSLFLNSCLIVKGKNGSGKTSLLKAISGISEDFHGQILWDLQNIQDFRSDFNGDLQFIGHKNFLKPDLTVFENLQFYAQIHDTEMLIPAALKFFKIEKLTHEKVKNLSEGMKKRILLAKLMVCPATIWILDEPSINLDEEGKHLLKGLIKTKLENQGIAIIATHDKDLFDLGPQLSMEDFN